LFGMISGPILGLFVLGIICPCTNYKVSRCGFTTIERTKTNVKVNVVFIINKLCDKICGGMAAVIYNCG